MEKLLSKVLDVVKTTHDPGAVSDLLDICIEAGKQLFCKIIKHLN